MYNKNPSTCSYYMQVKILISILSNIHYTYVCPDDFLMEFTHPVLHYNHIRNYSKVNKILHMVLLDTYVYYTNCMITCFIHIRTYVSIDEITLANLLLVTKNSSKLSIDYNIIRIIINYQGSIGGRIHKRHRLYMVLTHS